MLAVIGRHRLLVRPTFTTVFPVMVTFPQMGTPVRADLKWRPPSNGDPPPLIVTPSGPY